MAYESSGILMAAVFIPLLLSPVAYFIGKRKGIDAVTWFSFTVLLISAILLIIPGIRLSNENPIYQESYVWSQFGNFGLKLDGFSSPFAVTIYVLSTILVIFSKTYMVRKIAGQFDNLRPEKENAANDQDFNIGRYGKIDINHNQENGYESSADKGMMKHQNQISKSSFSTE